VLLQHLEDTLVNRLGVREILVGLNERFARACENRFLVRAAEVLFREVLTHTLEDVQPGDTQQSRIEIDLEVRKKILGRVELFEIGENAHWALLSLSSWVCCNWRRQSCVCESRASRNSMRSRSISSAPPTGSGIK